MSLKSFDKFLENYILGQPNNKKEIMDERQKIARTHILVETLIIFSGLSFISNFVMDLWYRWAESYASPMLIFFMLCMIYFNIRCFAKGCLIGINGGKAITFTAAYPIFMGVMMGAKYLIGNEEYSSLFADGKLTDDFCFIAAWILFVVYGVLTIILAKADKKRKGDE